jgi:hypothetical protein
MYDDGLDQSILSYSLDGNPDSAWAKAQVFLPMPSDTVARLSGGTFATRQS